PLLPSSITPPLVRQRKVFPHFTAGQKVSNEPVTPRRDTNLARRRQARIVRRCDSTWEGPDERAFSRRSRGMLPLVPASGQHVPERLLRRHADLPGRAAIRGMGGGREREAGGGRIVGRHRATAPAATQAAPGSW